MEDLEFDIYFGREDKEVISETEEPLKLTNPPVSSNEGAPGAQDRNLQGRKIDYSENDSKNKELGLMGEELVLKYEKKNLKENGRDDLAVKVEHTSQIIGDGVGYDIKSFDLDGNPKFIEVKTTKGGIRTPFIMTINEIKFSEKYSEHYFLYRVYEFSITTKSGLLFIVKGGINEKFKLDPIQFRVKL